MIDSGSTARPAQHLLRLVYISAAVPPNEPGTVQDILRASSTHNPLSSITGVLCTSESHFLQVLEGPEHKVLALYARVADDARHRDPVLLSIELVTERLFAGWSMGHIEGARDADDLYRALLPKRHLHHAKSQVAALVRSFINELNATSPL